VVITPRHSYWNRFIQAIVFFFKPRMIWIRWCRCFIAPTVAAADALAPTSALKSATGASWTQYVLSAKYPTSPTRTWRRTTSIIWTFCWRASCLATSTSSSSANCGIEPSPRIPTSNGAPRYSRYHWKTANRKHESVGSNRPRETWNQCHESWESEGGNVKIMSTNRE